MSHMPDDAWQSRPPYREPGPPSDEQAPFQRKLRGACHCGRVVYWLSSDKPLASKYCHCGDCQVLHGAPFQWAAIFQKSDMEFQHGASGLRFYNSATKRAEHDLPCKVSCSHCGTFIMDEGRNMALLFPTLLSFEDDEQRQNFRVRCHIFYPQRVVDIPDGTPKWEGLDQKSRLVRES